MIDINKIRELINGSSNVIIMAHKNLDLDALGSSLGIYYLCKKLNKNSFLLIDEDISEMGVIRSLKALKKQKLNINIKKASELKFVKDDKTLLIIVDVHIANITQNSDIISSINNIIILDHHTGSREGINKVSYEYINENQSSTSEIVVQLLEEMEAYIPPYVATIMLAGMVIDTNHFSFRTAHLTFEAASFLNQHGADPKELQYLLKEDLVRYIKRQKIIAKAEIIKKKFVIGTGYEKDNYYIEDLAKTSEILLLFNDIEASFTIGRINKNTVGISARSLGNVDVQKIMKKLGGGGHVTEAATQMTNISIDCVKEKLIKIINKI